VALPLRCGYFAGMAPAALSGGVELGEIQLPKGFHVQIYADGVEGARSLTLGPDGLVFVGSRDAGKVYALVDADEDHQGVTVKVIAQGLNSPNGVAYRQGSLFVAEISRVLRFDDIAARLDTPPEPVVVNATFPSETHHGWKFIAFGPDDRLYVPVGAPCNGCESKDERFASILRMRPDGSQLEVFARGVRNTVGFDWHPQTKELWFTDNGRDWMGDDRPPDELNRAPQPGMHFGFPYCHGKNLPDDEFRAMSCAETVAPVVELVPHVAALGMRFYTGDSFPAPWRDGIFIAEHGSWNRTDPAGYRVMFVPVRDSQAGPASVFASGWLDGGVARGRPVDVAVLSDGSLLVSDDKANLVYRIHHSG
jgi:glucose/arabinose dehydrogenase